jgi:glyoxylase-like metal-dependent hydrolase (beta-lactamase superfamily II)
LTANETYDVFAVRYATREAKRADHFLDKAGLPNPDGPMPMDYFVWLVQGASQSFVVDTGFTEPVGTRRGRTYLRRPADGLRLLGVDAAAAEDVIVTHMHYDHAGTVSDFPKARLHLQEQELRWVTSSEMFRRGARGSFEVDDVINMVRGLYDERVQLHDGDWQPAPGATHYYENMETKRPFVTTHDASKVLAGFETLHELAASPRHIVPGHDPLVMQRYPAASQALEGVAVRLDAEPEY